MNIAIQVSQSVLAYLLTMPGDWPDYFALLNRFVRTGAVPQRLWERPLTNVAIGGRIVDSHRERGVTVVNRFEFTEVSFVSGPMNFDRHLHKSRWYTNVWIWLCRTISKLRRYIAPHA